MSRFKPDSVGADPFGMLHEQVVRVLRTLVPELPPDLPERVRLWPGSEPGRGDASTNAVLVAAGAVGRDPSELAAALAERMAAENGVRDATIAGPGFVNLSLEPRILRDILPGILRAGAAYGRSATGVGKRAIVAYEGADGVSPARPCGNRAVAMGEAVGELLGFAGYAVSRHSSGASARDAELVVTVLAPGGAAPSRPEPRIAPCGERGPDRRTLCCAPVHLPSARRGFPGRGEMAAPEPPWQPGALRFALLSRPAGQPVAVPAGPASPWHPLEPGFRVQHAHARCRSVLRAAAAAPGYGDTDSASLAAVVPDELSGPRQGAVLRRLAWWPRITAAAASALAPHEISSYLNDLSEDLDVLWHHAPEGGAFRFLRPGDVTATRTALALLAGTAIVIRTGLALLGIAAVEELRG